MKPLDFLGNHIPMIPIMLGQRNAFSIPTSPCTIMKNGVLKKSKKAGKERSPKITVSPRKAKVRIFL
jgi:hypothetical protein